MGRGSRGRRRGRRKSKAARSSRSKASSSRKSSRSKSRRRSTAASKRRRVRSVAKSRRAANRSATSKSKTKRRRVKNIRKTLKQRIASAGLNKKKTETKKKTVSASQSRKQVRQKTKENIANRKKLTIRSLLGNLTRPRGAYASNAQGKPMSKLRRQLSNLKKNVQQQSTKEARFNRRADRLQRQFGLDTRDMRNLKLNVDMDTVLRQKLKIPGTDIKIGLNDRLRKALPKSIRNFRTDVNLGGKFRSPHKLGVREGYRAPNRGGTKLVEGQVFIPRFGRVGGGIRGIPRNIHSTPRRDWLSRLYRSHNISGGKLDQKARDYWSNEAKTKGRDAVIQSIIGTSRAEGTYGGRRKRPRRGKYYNFIGDHQYKGPLKSPIGDHQYKGPLRRS